MDLRLSDEQEQLVGAFSAMYTKESTPERVRASEPDGFDAELWAQLVELGVVSMAVPEQEGGWGAATLDLALVAEQHGRYVAPAPLVEAMVAARLLARCGTAAAAATLASVMDNSRMVTLALRPARAGVAELVPGAAVADDALVLTGERLQVVPLDGNRQPVRNLGAMSLADVSVPEDAPVIATGTDARELFERAVDEWMTLTANALVGVAARALEIGVAYAKERHAFGVPIGSFQGVSHRLADCATAVDGARLLAYEAAWAHDDDEGAAAELAAMTFAFSAQTARDTAYWSLHFHGGYGFMLEYDIQLYYRRAWAWPGVLFAPGSAYQRVADRRYGARS